MSACKGFQEVFHVREGGGEVKDAGFEDEETERTQHRR